MSLFDVESMRRQAETPVLAGAGDLAGVARDLADAFALDPIFDWFVRADGARAKARLRFFRSLMGIVAPAGGKIERPADGGAAAVWMPFSYVRPSTLTEDLRSLPMILRTTGFGRFGRALALQKDMHEHHPTDREHAYLWFIGVAPQAQGRGVGSRLLKVATDRLDAQSMPAYLETQTERNVGLYRRHGFEIISEHKARPDAPTMWSMWRDPQNIT